MPVWKRYTLTVTEAAEYYHIGEGKLRSIAEEHKSD
ncbi:MAG: transposase, partial [Ruminococcus sp.]|nr:transposase [Ruminococcus sp.]